VEAALAAVGAGKGRASRRLGHHTTTGRRPQPWEFGA
jgi:hypothetical protein